MIEQPKRPRGRPRSHLHHMDIALTPAERARLVEAAGGEAALIGWAVDTLAMVLRLRDQGVEIPLIAISGRCSGRNRRGLVLPLPVELYAALPQERTARWVREHLLSLSVLAGLVADGAIMQGGCR